MERLALMTILPCLQVSTSAMEACAQYWPELFASLGEEERHRVRQGLRATRPRLIKGWEALVMARLVLEDDRWAGGKDVQAQGRGRYSPQVCAAAERAAHCSLPPAHLCPRPSAPAPPCSNVQRILHDWQPLLARTLAAWGEGDGAALAAAFESHRAGQLASAPDSWLSLNPLYPGVADALQACPYPFYIASSKAASRLVPLLRASLGMQVEEGSPRIFASLIPPNERKIEALRRGKGQPPRRRQLPDGCVRRTAGSAAPLMPPCECTAWWWRPAGLHGAASLGLSWPALCPSHGGCKTPSTVPSSGRNGTCQNAPEPCLWRRHLQGRGSQQ